MPALSLLERFCGTGAKRWSIALVPAGTAFHRTHKGFTGFSFRRSLAAREDVPSPARRDVIGGERMAANALCAADGPASF